MNRNLFARLASLLAFVCLALSASAQTGSVDHWETVVYCDDSWRYKVGSEEPSASWINLSYDDSGWLEGPGGVGYGDSDDNTIIDVCPSLYLRIKFEIFDLSEIGGCVLHVDYDDAFVAYLNGHEIARANISGDYPSFNQQANYAHEAQMYSGGLPEQFIFSKKYLVEGNNILALQVHNIVATSNDLSSTTYLSVGINNSSTTYSPIPEWFDDATLLTSSNLPILVIDTRGEIIPDEPKVYARMGIIDNGVGQRNDLGDDFNGYDGHIGIELRGQITQTFPKKPYLIETRYANGDNYNVPVLGFPRENDWILRASYLDKTFIRNPLVHYMSRRMGNYSSGTRFVELILNGQYEGIYIFMEQVKRDRYRINVTEMTADDTSGDRLTGGYIYEVAQTGAGFGKRRRFVYPKSRDITDQQVEYIKNYDDSFRDAVAGPDYADPDLGYAAWIDVNSFIDEILIQEASKNSDAYAWSSFFHKDRLDKLKAGPVWDFDAALSNSVYNCGECYAEWNIDKDPPTWMDDYPTFWKTLFNEPSFKAQLSQRWFQLREGPFATDSLLAFIDMAASSLLEAESRNFARWPILGVELYRSTPGWSERDTYQKEVDYLKDYLRARLEWMDAELAQVPISVSPVLQDAIPDQIQLMNIPNPFNAKTIIRYVLPRQSDIILSIYDLSGREIIRWDYLAAQPGDYSQVWDGTDRYGITVSSGIYLYRFDVGNQVLTKKMLLLK